jgi:hypothetical protein
MIQQYIKGKPLEEVIKHLEFISDDHIIKNCIKYGLFHLLPRDKNGICTYNGNLLVQESNITKLPDNLTVNGDLYCDNNKITKLPIKLNIKGSLYCEHNLLTELPDDLTVEYNLYCAGNKLTKLPNFFDNEYRVNNSIGSGVIRGLNCNFNDLTYLPNNMVIAGDLYCSYNNLTKLPENLSVYGDLICKEQQTGIKLELPKSAKISGSFRN